MEYIYDYEIDTVIVPTTPRGFEDVFIDKNAWYPLELGKKRLTQLKYVAVYQRSPVSAITHYAKIGRIEKYQDTNDFAIYFDGLPIEIKPIKYNTGSVAPQKQRYTTLKRILSSKQLSDILGL